MLTFVILAIIFIAPTITVHIGREVRGGGGCEAGGELDMKNPNLNNETHILDVH